MRERKKERERETPSKDWNTRSRILHNCQTAESPDIEIFTLSYSYLYGVYRLERKVSVIKTKLGDVYCEKTWAEIAAESRFTTRVIFYPACVGWL